MNGHTCTYDDDGCCSVCGEGEVRAKPQKFAGLRLSAKQTDRDRLIAEVGEKG